MMNDVITIVAIENFVALEFPAPSSFAIRTLTNVDIYHVQEN